MNCHARKERESGRRAIGTGIGAKILLALCARKKKRREKRYKIRYDGLPTSAASKEMGGKKKRGRLTNSTESHALKFREREKKKKKASVLLLRHALLKKGEGGRKTRRKKAKKKAEAGTRKGGGGWVNTALSKVPNSEKRWEKKEVHGARPQGSTTTRRIKRNDIRRTGLATQVRRREKSRPS